MSDIIYWCIYPDGSTPDPTASEIVGETYASATAYGNDTGPGVTTADFTGAAITGSYSGDYRIAAVWSDGTNYSNVAISDVISVIGPEGIVYWCIYPDGSSPDPTVSEIVGETYASATAYGNDTGPGVTTADFTGAAIAGSYSGDYHIAAVWFDGTNYSNVAISGVVSVGGGGSIIEADLTISTFSGMTPGKNTIFESGLTVSNILSTDPILANSVLDTAIVLSSTLLSEYSYTISLEAAISFINSLSIIQDNQAVINAGLTLSSISNITVNGSVLSLEVTLPCGRTLLVSIEDRTLQIQADNRTISINGCN